MGEPPSENFDSKIDLWRGLHILHIIEGNRVVIPQILSEAAKRKGGFAGHARRTVARQHRALPGGLLSLKPLTRATARRVD
jgi:hypothetical protein